MQAFRCDKCGEFKDGSSEGNVTVVIDDYELKVTASKRKAPIADSAKEGHDMVSSIYTAMVWYHVPDNSIDLCNSCMDGLIQSIPFVTVQ